MKKSRGVRGHPASSRAVRERRGGAVAGLAVFMVAASLAGLVAVSQATLADDATPQPGQAAATLRPGQVATMPQPDLTAATFKPDDRAVATRTAKARGRWVEVESEKTESSSLWANPDGTPTSRVISPPRPAPRPGRPRR